MGNAVEKIEQKPLTSNAVTPMDMLQSALERGTDMEQLTKLMDLQERWEKNEARKAYVTAISKFRETCPTIDKTRTGHNIKYAGLAETLEQIRGILSDCGLSHSWKTNQEGGQITVTCCVTHIGGHQECTSMSAQADGTGSKNAIQAIGSTITYLERYTLYAILGLASREHDDDGKAAGLGPTITEEQEATISAKMKEVNADTAGFLTHLGVEKLADLPATKFNFAMSSLATKAKQQEAK